MTDALLIRANLYANRLKHLRRPIQVPPLSALMICLMKYSVSNPFRNTLRRFKRLSEKADLPRSRAYVVPRRFNSRHILIDKTEGLKRQRVTILMDRIRAKLDEASNNDVLAEAESVS